MNQPLRSQPAVLVSARTTANATPNWSPMDPDEAADFLRMNRRMLLEWSRKGYIPAHPLGVGSRKKWRFIRHELEAWLNAQTNGIDAQRR